jgi:DNA-binding MltR family transcriptional regulator
MNDVKQWPEVDAFLQELNAENAGGTERGSVLVMCSMLDILLGRLLKSFLSNHPTSDQLLNNGGLKNLSARLDACTALGLITQRDYKTALALNAIRKDFAHRVGVAFGQGPLIQKLAALSKDAEWECPPNVSPKGQYTLIGTALLARISAAIPATEVARRPMPA